VLELRFWLPDWVRAATVTLVRVVLDPICRLELATPDALVTPECVMRVPL
jgi:hypothetical protein